MSDITLNPNFEHCGSCEWFDWVEGECLNSKSEDYNGQVNEESVACEEFEDKKNED